MRRVISHFGSAIAAGRGAETAETEGVALNQLINVAVAEKLSHCGRKPIFAERASRGSTKKALRILDRAGVGNPPMRGDRLKSK